MGESTRHSTLWNLILIAMVIQFAFSELTFHLRALTTGFLSQRNPSGNTLGRQLSAWLLSLPNPTISSSLHRLSLCLLCSTRRQPKESVLYFFVLSHEKHKHFPHLDRFSSVGSFCFPPFLTFCLNPASITRWLFSLGIAYGLITFQEFNEMTGGQANLWSDKWRAKWRQSTGRKIITATFSELFLTVKYKRRQI